MEEIKVENVKSEDLIKYTNIALYNAKWHLKRNEKVKALEEYKRYKNLKDMLDCFVYRKGMSGIWKK